MRVVDEHMLRNLVRWALAILLVMAAFSIGLSAVAGLAAGFGAWLLFRLVDAPLFEELHKEFLIAAVTVGVGVFFAALAKLMGLASFSNSHRD